MKSLLLVFGLFLIGGAHAAELYRSIDASGKVYYSDKPLPEAQDVEQLRTERAPAPEASLPYETRRAMENFPVTLYTFPDCGPACQQARVLLNKRGIPFKEVSLTKKEDIEAFRKASGDIQVPALSIGKSWLSGFLAEKWHSELDIAGYPKTAPYGLQLPAAPTPAPAKAEPAAPPAQPEQQAQ